MTEVKSIEQLSLVLGFLVPGLVALYVRSQSLTGRMQASWVLVTLKDGTRFAGFCGSASFISPDPQEWGHLHTARL